MISLILVTIAAICNAIMDVVDHKYNLSIFVKLNRQWWDPSVSWLNKYEDRNYKNGRRKIFGNINYPVQLTDAWHLFKTLNLVLWGFAVVLYNPIIEWWVDVFIIGCCRNLTFSLFYKKVFRI